MRQLKIGNDKFQSSDSLLMKSRTKQEHEMCMKGKSGYKVARWRVDIKLTNKAQQIAQKDHVLLE